MSPQSPTPKGQKVKKTTSSKVDPFSLDAYYQQLNECVDIQIQGTPWSKLTFLLENFAELSHYS